MREAVNKRGMPLSFLQQSRSHTFCNKVTVCKWKDKQSINGAYHSGVFFRSSIISNNSQSVQVPLLSVQQACHCDPSLKDHTPIMQNVTQSIMKVL